MKTQPNLGPRHAWRDVLLAVTLAGTVFVLLALALLVNFTVRLVAAPVGLGLSILHPHTLHAGNETGADRPHGRVL